MVPPGCSLVMVMAAVTGSLAVTPAVSELIELTYTYNVNAPTSPKLRQFKQELVMKGRNKQRQWVELYNICLSEHSGTHIDAPRHFNETGWTVEAIPTDRLWRLPAVVVDVSKMIGKSQEKNYEVTPKDLTDWEAEHGVIPDGALVFVRTGWGKMVNNYWSYAGLDENNKLNFPGLGKEAAEWLVHHGQNNSHSTGIVGVGIDTLSLDNGHSVRMPAHITLFAANIYGIENVANLDKLPAVGSHVTVMPMRIGKGSGAPARIIAEIGEGPMSLAPALRPFLPALLLPLFPVLRAPWGV
ncbi:isatin hydrolase-like [Eriocheir sinensis]|uniref:isatin hydrolase-like n=1 Tax=Eriocheir sinensis TaxID=95602 RepID=UPI0021C7B3FE|nr:isatin hydrolase-like [Eriocheir sinensis]XP_050713054.1 isatin hydrolase-like [Eriocheir sinensis]XP_050713055.1 isatin hydrolase-like [Eriocheir sinensis]